MKHIGTYRLNELLPTPQVDNKYNLQVKKKRNGNGVYNKAFGTCDTERHKDFGPYFTISRESSQAEKDPPKLDISTIFRHAIHISKA